MKGLYWIPIIGLIPFFIKGMPYNEHDFAFYLLPKWQMFCCAIGFGLIIALINR